MGAERDMALYTLSVPRQVGSLRPARKRAQAWLHARAVAAEVRDAVVWVLDAALSSSIDHLIRNPRVDDGSEAEVALHIDDDVVVLTATNHFTWSLDTIATDGVQADEWRTMVGYADQISLTDIGDPDPGTAATFTAVFNRET
ncbi:hypothetical protein [Actinokineospora pegani]|uniref:hypothetical protein n=1 Tax=Actinokineospora pegani TaxID=2654637 RepID=UPI0018D43550|nr:hypothetical protein [Actinokineospora pegani]